MRNLLDGTVTDSGARFDLFRPLDEEERRLLDRAIELVPEIQQRARRYDEAAEFPVQDIDALKEAGLLTLTVPRELGGHGLWSGSAYLPYYLILQTIAAASMSTAWVLRVHCNACGMVAGHANAEQRERILGEVVRRGALLATVGSEADPKQRGQAREHPTGSSDLTRTDGGYILNTTKHFASNGPAATTFVVHTTVPGEGERGERYQLLAVPHDAEGVSLEDNWDVMGARATVSWAVHFENVFVPDSDVLGNPGDWVYADPRTMTASHAAVLLGTAEGVFDFIKTELMARPSLAANDYIAYQFGEMDSHLQAARMSLWYAALLWECGSHGEAEMASLRAVHMAKETALMTTTRAFEIYGARGTVKSLPLERAYRDMRILSLHHRELTLMRLLTDADLGVPFHPKQNYGPPKEIAGVL